MQRYFAKNKNLDLEETDYHHIKNVMRMKKNDLIEIVYDNTIYTCKLTDVNDVHFDIIKKEEKTYDGPKVIVAFSLLKEQKLDYLMQKSTEAGAYKFIPLITKRSIIKVDNKKEDKKKIRWQKILKEASEQSFRSFIPEIEDITMLKDLINYNADLKLLFTVNEKSKNIKKVLQNGNKYDTILIVIGPEGGFDKTEEEYLVKNGFLSTTLGSTVLRAETAPVVAIGMINYEFMR